MPVVGSKGKTRSKQYMREEEEYCGGWKGDLIVHTGKVPAVRPFEN